MFKIRVPVCAAMLLAACGAPPTRHDDHMPGAAASAASPSFVIDSGHSEVRILVYRAGPMARLGHNHVIIHRAVRGWVADGGPQAGFVLQLPVADFRIDESEPRAQEGPDFGAPVPDDAKAGTRRNMLGPAVLDAEHFPVITLTSIALDHPVETAPKASGPPGEWVAHMTVEVAGHASTVAARFVLARGEGSLNATGTVQLRQSDLGLTPLRIMLGALQVQDEFTVKFTLSASRG